MIFVLIINLNFKTFSIGIYEKFIICESICDEIVLVCLYEKKH